MTADDLGTYNDVWEDLSLGIAPVPIFPREPMRTDDAFYLGFEDSLAGSVIQLDIRATVEGIGVGPAPPTAGVGDLAGRGLGSGGDPRPRRQR